MTKNRFTVLQPLPTESCIEERDLMNEKYVIHPIQVGTIIRKKAIWSTAAVPRKPFFH